MFIFHPPHVNNAMGPSSKAAPRTAENHRQKLKAADPGPSAKVQRVSTDDSSVAVPVAANAPSLSTSAATSRKQVVRRKRSKSRTSEPTPLSGAARMRPDRLTSCKAFAAAELEKEHRKLKHWTKEAANTYVQALGNDLAAVLSKRQRAMRQREQTTHPSCEPQQTPQAPHSIGLVAHNPSRAQLSRQNQLQTTQAFAHRQQPLMYRQPQHPGKIIGGQHRHQPRLHVAMVPTVPCQKCRRPVRVQQAHTHVICMGCVTGLRNGAIVHNTKGPQVYSRPSTMPATTNIQPVYNINTSKRPAGNYTIDLTQSDSDDEARPPGEPGQLVRRLPLGLQIAQSNTGFH